MKPVLLPKKQKSVPHKRTEDDLQAACVRWFRFQYPRHIIVSFPAGFVFGGDAAKRAITANRMKAMGYENGFPDLMVIMPNKVHFIEMKSDGCYLKPVQKEVHNKLKGLGFEVAVCKSFEDFENVIKG